MTSTAISWGLTFALIGVVTYLYKPDLFRQPSPQPRSIQAKSEPTEDSLKKQHKKSKSKKTSSSKVEDTVVPAPSDLGGKKRKIVASATQDIPNGHASDRASTKSPKQDDSGDKEFAQQLMKTQTGTKLQRADDAQSKNASRTRKQSKLEHLSVADVVPPTEGDADNDASSIEPSLSDPADLKSQVAKSGDVSDMLEAPAPKPTTLRLTGIPDDSKSKKKSASNPAEPALTKKQRQNQARKEEMRQLREESDRLHEAKKQEQLRRARMAEGTSKQTRATQFSSSGTSAWQAQNQEKVKAAPPNSAPLLDTFEPSSTLVSQATGAVSTQSIEESSVNSATQLKQALGDGKASAAAASGREGAGSKRSNWMTRLSEEDQMKLIEQQNADDAWEDVTNKKGKKKSKKDNDTGSEASFSVPPSVRSINKPKSNGVQSKTSQPEPDLQNRFNTFENGALADADWEA